jgi:type I restriction enzyme S subunit
LTPLGEVLSHRKEFNTIADTVEYKRCRVQLHAKGIVERDRVPGTMIKTKEQQICRANELLVAEIDAKVGGFGIVPPELEGAIVSSHYFLFTPDVSNIDPEFLGYFVKTPAFRDQVTARGSTNYAAIRPHHVLGYEIPLPPLAEQRRIVAKIERLAAKIEEARGLQDGVKKSARAALRSEFSRIARGAQMRSMGEVAPLVRRPVEIAMDATYPELGIRSFGQGTFHKPELTGFEVGSKRLFEIHAEDLLFNIVFAWEGAVAVAHSVDHGRFGSHRFLTCVPRPEMTTSEFLRFYFLTPEGLEKLGRASPGGAGRNRTLGLKPLEHIEVPVPSIDQQLWFDRLQAKVDRLKALQAETRAELEALLPTILDRAFEGEL